MTYMKKAECEKIFAKSFKNCGGIVSWCDMYVHGSWYYQFNCKNGVIRYWTNPSKWLLNKLGIKSEDYKKEHY